MGKRVTGKHRKRHIRRAYLTMGLAAASVLLGGVGYALAEPSPVPVVIAGDPVLPGEAVTPPVPARPHPVPPARIYIAKEADSLWSIAASQCGNGNDWKPLASANHISYPYPVLPGQKITVRCS